MNHDELRASSTGAWLPQQGLTSDLVAREAARIAAKERMRAQAEAANIPAGRQTIQGTVRSLRDNTRHIPNAWDRSVRKMMLVSGDGVTYYGSVPMGLHPKVGDIVALCATVTFKRPGFAYFSRPTKPTIVQEVGQNIT